ncbi:MAG: hypothetical protein QY316_00485 [Thermodesulfobacteriota bacterium]|nr:MAG: hypothetical protein QY316_00485 [Thermodesulfobacteriota bacterium]
MAIEDLLQQPPWEFYSARLQPDPPYDPVFTVYQDYFTWTKLFAGPSYGGTEYGDEATAYGARELAALSGTPCGNFRHDFYFKITEFEGGGTVGTHRLQIYELTSAPIWDPNWEENWAKTYLYADIRRETEGGPLKAFFSISYTEEIGVNPETYSTEATISLNTGYYGRFERVDGGTYGRVNLKLFSDAARTNLVTTLTLDFDREIDEFVYGDNYWALWNICNRAQRYSSGEMGGVDLHIPQTQSLAGTGGFILGGSADMTGEPASPSITGSGGFILGGTAVIKRGAVRHGQGGLVLGGRAAFLSWVLDSAAEQSGQIDPAFWGWRAGGDSIAFWGWSGGMSTAVPYSLIRIKPYVQTTITVPDY